jgi:hypothetical protein
MSVTIAMVAFQQIASSSNRAVIQWLQNDMSLSDRTSRKIPENAYGTVALSRLQDCSNQIKNALARVCRRNKNTSDIRGFN